MAQKVILEKILPAKFPKGIPSFKKNQNSLH